MLQYGCNLQFTTPLCPTSNGLVERVNRKIKRYLQLWEATTVNWQDHLGMSIYVINHEYNQSIQTSSWIAFHGWSGMPGNIVNPKEIFQEYTIGNQCSPARFATEQIRKMQKSLAKLYETDKKQKECRFNKLRREYHTSKGSKMTLKAGDHVLIKTPQLKGQCKKLFIAWRGRYVLHEQVDKNVWTVSLLNNSRRKFLVHTRRMRKIWSPTVQEDTYGSKEEYSQQAEEFPQEVGNEVLPDKVFDSNELPEDSEIENLNITDDVLSNEVAEPQEGQLRSGKQYKRS